MANTRKSNSVIKRISSIIGNNLIAEDIYSSVTKSHIPSDSSHAEDKLVWSVFSKSLNSAIRDIEEHPKGKLFKRLIEFGPPYFGQSETLISDNTTNLSDSECATCIEFIYSHMISRFKGELAELLAIQPCSVLINNLKKSGRLPIETELFYGDNILERSHKKNNKNEDIWSSYLKGADGLLAHNVIEDSSKENNRLFISGLIEIKSMPKSMNALNKQINKHIERLNGGLKLGKNEWNYDEIIFPKMVINSGESTAFVKIMVVPATWKLNRKWEFKNLKVKRVLLPPELDVPPVRTISEELLSDIWKITLSWSKEALDQASYEMTYWYMSQVGESIYKNKALPKGWEDMSPKEAGYNAIKMMLYYLPKRPISERKIKKAVKLYNIYCFGYPLGIESKEMLWPEDIDKMVNQ